MATGTSFQNSFNILSRFKDSLDQSKDAGRIVLKKDVQKALEALEYIDVLYSSPSLPHQVESVMQNPVWCRPYRALLQRVCSKVQHNNHSS